MQANRDVCEFGEHAKNSSSQRRRHCVGYLLHLIGKRAVNAETVREALQPRCLTCSDAAWFFKMCGRCTMPGEECIRQAGRGEPASKQPPLCPAQAPQFFSSPP